MNLSSIKKYLLEGGYEIRITNSYVNIKNYKDIGDFNSNNITIYYDGGKVNIKGSNMRLTHIISNEILIVGDIYSLELG